MPPAPLKKRSESVSNWSWMKNPAHAPVQIVMTPCCAASNLIQPQSVKPLDPTLSNLLKFGSPKDSHVFSNVDMQLPTLPATTVYGLSMNKLCPCPVASRSLLGPAE